MSLKLQELQEVLHLACIALFDKREVKSNYIQYREMGIQDPSRQWAGNEAWRVSRSFKVGETAPRTASYSQTHSAWYTWCAAPGNAICCAFHVNCAWWDWQCSRAPSFTGTGNCQPGVCHSHLVGLLCSRMRNPQPTMEALPAPEVMLPSCSCSPHQFGTTSHQGEPMGHMSRQSD